MHERSCSRVVCSEKWPENMSGEPRRFKEKRPENCKHLVFANRTRIESTEFLAALLPPQFHETFSLTI